MPMDRQVEIIALLSKLGDKIDEVHKDIGAVEQRLASLEAWKDSRVLADKHFWSVTWPGQAEIVKSVEERMRVVERSSIMLSRIDDLDDGLRKVLPLLTVEPRIEKLEDKVEKLDQLAVKTRLVIGLVAFLGGGLGTVVTTLIVKSLT